MHSRSSKGSRHMLRMPLERKSNDSEMIKEGNTCQRNSKTLWMNVELQGSIPVGTDHSKMELLSVQIESLLKGLWLCWKSLVCPRNFGLSVWLRVFTCLIVVLHLLSKERRHMKYGIRRNLKLVICGFGGVLHMFIFRRTRGGNWVHMWRSAFSLDIHRATRVGNFITLKPRRSSSLNELTLMNVTHMVENYWWPTKRIPLHLNPFQSQRKPQLIKMMHHLPWSQRNTPPIMMNRRRNHLWSTERTYPWSGGRKHLSLMMKMNLNLNYHLPNAVQSVFLVHLVNGGKLESQYL